jgi:aspartate kinase
MLPAMRCGIPLRVRNTQDPEAEGTTIEATARVERPAVRAISHRASVALVTVTSPRLVPAHAFLARVFAELSELSCDVGPVAVSEAGVTFALDRGVLAAARERLRAIGEVTSEDDQAVVGVVGDAQAIEAGAAATALATLAEAGIAVRCAGQGAHASTVALVVAAADLARTVALLHERFFSA